MSDATNDENSLSLLDELKKQRAINKGLTERIAKGIGALEKLKNAFIDAHDGYLPEGKPREIYLKTQDAIREMEVPVTTEPAPLPAKSGEAAGSADLSQQKVR